MTVTLARAHVIAEQYLAQVLPPAVTSAGGTGVYRHPAPEEATVPFVTVSYLGGRAIRPNGRTLQGVEVCRFDVSAWDTGKSALRAAALLDAAVAAIEAGAPATLPDGWVVSATRTGPLGAPGTTVERGITWQREAALIEILVST
jgi:hypothetical protein